MNTNPSRSIGFRKSSYFGRCNDRCGGGHRIGWRFWIGPLIVARTPGIRPGITVRWTR